MHEPEQKDHPQKGESNLKKLARFILLKHYSDTLKFTEQLIWPITTLLLLLFFHGQVADLIKVASSSIARSQRIEIHGLIIEGPENLFEQFVTDKNAYVAMNFLTPEELRLVLKYCYKDKHSFQYVLSDESTQENIDELKVLKELEFVAEDPPPVPIEIPNVGTADIEYTVKPNCHRIHQEFQNIMLKLINP